MSPDDHALRTLHATWIAAVNAGDLTRLLTLVTDDVVFMTPGRAPFGLEGFRDGFLDGHRRFRLTCTSVMEELFVDGDLACARSRDSLSLRPHRPSESGASDAADTSPAAAAHVLVGDRLNVYRRGADGRWALARDLHNLQPVAS